MGVKQIKEIMHSIYIYAITYYYTLDTLHDKKSSQLVMYSLVSNFNHS